MKFSVIILCWTILADYPVTYVLSTSSSRKNPTNRVTNGYNARRYQFPYQVSIQYDYGLDMQIWDHVCGGSIISPTFVLTAAHCKFLDGNMKIIAGITNLGEQAQERQDILVAEVIHYPTYPVENKVIALGDIALMRLSSRLIWSQAVQPVTISQRFEESGYGILTGWGEVSSDNTVLPPVSLQWAEVPILNTPVCKEVIQSLSNDLSDAIDNTVICTNTGSTTYPVSACHGDSGGPLVQNGILIGVVSWGITPCGDIPNAPTMYSRVSSYVPWIMQYVIDL